jgi:hypothetical protein
MALRADGRRSFEVRLGDEEPISYPFFLRYLPDEIAQMVQPTKVTGTITTPWRVVVAGRTLNDLVNADIIHNVAPPPDPAIFPDGVKTSWIRPGRAVWRYLDGGDNTFDGIKHFSALAGELGFEHHVVEGIWERGATRSCVSSSKTPGRAAWASGCGRPAKRWRPRSSSVRSSPGAASSASWAPRSTSSITKRRT